MEIKPRSPKPARKLVPIAWPKARRLPMRWRYSRFLDVAPEGPTSGYYEAGWEVRAELDSVPVRSQAPWVLDYTGQCPLAEEFHLSRYNAERWKCSWKDMRGARRSDPEAYVIFPNTEEGWRLRLQQELQRKA